MPLFQSEVLKEMLPQTRVKHDFLSLCWLEEGEAQCGLPSPCKASVLWTQPLSLVPLDEEEEGVSPGGKRFAG